MADLAPIFRISLQFQIFNKIQPYILHFARLKILQHYLSTTKKFSCLDPFIIINFYHQMLSRCILNYKFKVFIPNRVQIIVLQRYKVDYKQLKCSEEKGDSLLNAIQLSCSSSFCQATDVCTTQQRDQIFLSRLYWLNLLLGQALLLILQQVSILGHCTKRKAQRENRGKEKKTL